MSSAMSHFVITPTVLLPSLSYLDTMSKTAWFAGSFVPFTTQLSRSVYEYQCCDDTYMMTLCLGFIYDSTMLLTPSFSLEVRPFIRDWKIPGTSRMLKWERSGPEISTFNTSSEKLRFPSRCGLMAMVSSDIARLIFIASVALITCQNMIRPFW